MPSNEHDCPMCGRERVPIWRALCGPCFSILPWKFRAEYMHAYRCRIVDPIAWQEIVIYGRQWFIGRNTPVEREEK